MARYTPSAIFESFDGKIGNSVFTKNKGGRYLRNFVVPSNPQTSRQLEARSAFLNSSDAWYTLSDAERTLWNNFAAIGFNPLQPKENGYSGRQAFVSFYNTCKYGNDFYALGLLSDMGIYCNALARVVPSAVSNYLASDSPATEVLDTKIHLKTASPCSANITGLDITVTTGTPNKIKAAFTVDSGLTGEASSCIFTFGGAQASGIAGGCKIYLSNIIPAGSSAYGNRFRTVALQIPPEVTGTLTAVAYTSVGFEMAVTDPYILTAGYYYATVVFCSKKGTQKIAWSGYVTVA